MLTWTKICSTYLKELSMSSAQQISFLGYTATVQISFSAGHGMHHGVLEIHSQELADSYAYTCPLTNESGGWSEPVYVIAWGKLRLRNAVLAFLLGNRPELGPLTGHRP